MKYTFLIICLILAFTLESNSKVWTVSPGGNYKLCSQVSPLVADGDTVLVDSALYENDIQVTWRKNNLLINFIAKLSNNNSVTTINGLPLYKPNTTTSPILIGGKAYTIWYNSTSNCFFIKASAEGTTIASHVLAGDTFSNDSDTGLIGTMPNNGTLNYSLPINGTYNIPLGYVTGGSVTQNISYINVYAVTVQGVAISESYFSTASAANVISTGVNDFITKSNAETGSSYESIYVENGVVIFKGSVPSSLERVAK
jgi:hypothetical protein